MAVSATVVSRITAVETGLGVTQDLATATASITHELAAMSTTLTASTTPAISQVWADSFNLSGGAATVDLTSLARTGLSTLDLTGLKVQVIQIRSRSTNTDTVTVQDGASNGYDIFGSSSGLVVLKAGGSILFYSPEGLADVASGDRTIDFSSSDADATVDVVILAG